MRTYWDDVVRRIRGERRLSRELLVGMAGHVGVLPGRPPRRRRTLTRLIVFVLQAVAIALAVGAVLGLRLQV